MKRLRRVLGSGLMAAAGVAAALGQAAPTPSPTPESGRESRPYPEAYEVVSRADDVADAAAAAELDIARIADVADVSQEVDAAVTRSEALQDELNTARREAYLRPTRLSILSDQALADIATLEKTRKEVGTRLKALAEIRRRWTERRDFWAGWAEALRSDPQWESLAQQLAQAEGNIRSVADRTAEAFPALLAVEERLERIRRQGLEIVEGSEELRERQRRSLLQRSGPPLLSREYWAGLSGEIGAQLSSGIRTRSRVKALFFRRNAGIILLQLLAAACIAYAVRRIRRAGREEEGWAVLRHPWAVGAFGALLGLSGFYGPSPAVWQLLLWTALAISSSILAASMFANRRQRILIYSVAVLIPVFGVLEWIALPESFFSLIVSAVAAAGIPFLLLLARRNARALGRRHWFSIALSIGAAILGAVLVAEILGFGSLGRWLLSSAVGTAFAGFVVAFLVRLVRGAVAVLGNRADEGRFPFLSQALYQLGLRLGRLFEALFVFWAALSILNVWQIAPSPWKTWQTLIGAGFSVGSVRITVGRLLSAALVFYFALLLSAALRALLRARVVEHHGLEPGVSDSVAKLLHYAVVLVGVVLAVSAIGVELRSFALVAGALGVGIGFGLQGIVNNLVSGLVLLFERPVRAGDTVVVGSDWGVIKHIGLRATVVSVFDGSEIVVPNGELVSQKLTNWTLSSRKNRVIVEVGVAYGSDLEKVFGILKAAAAAHPDVLKDPAPQILFAGFGDSSLNFEMRVWLPDVTLRLATMSDLRSAVDRRFREAGVEIPFPQRDLHVRSVDADAAASLAPARRPAPPP